MGIGQEIIGERGVGQGFSVSSGDIRQGDGVPLGVVEQDRAGNISDHSAKPGGRGELLDVHTRGSEFSLPLSGNDTFTYVGTQMWCFYCDECGEQLKIPSVTGESGAQAITRTLYPLTADTCNPFSRIWRIRTIKHDFSAWQDWMVDPWTGASIPIGDSRGPY